VRDPDRSDTLGVALVTGASKGLGRAISLRLAADGYDIALVARDRDGLEEASSEIRALGRRAAAFSVDVRSVALIEPTVAQIEDQLGTVSVLVNNAGVLRIASPFETTEADWDTVMETNVRAPFFWSRYVGDRMRREHRGAVVNISSAAGLRPYPGRSAYGTSKAAVIMMTKILALELAPFGIRVNAVAPTFVDVGVSRLTLTSDANTQSVVSEIPLGRLATTDDVSSAVSYLAGPASAFITGAVIPVDGGLALGSSTGNA
jgi:2-deoxy-D-gluconate 3-dehydrogenase